MIEPFAKETPKVNSLVSMLLEWINSEFVEQRILVRDLEEDLYDGQILQKLIEKLSGIKVDHPEVTQSEMGQKQRLKVVLETINQMLNVYGSLDTSKWTVEKIYSKDLVAILRLLVALARHYKAPIRMPDGVCIRVLLVRKLNGQLNHWRQNEIITDSGFHLLNEATDEQDAFSVLVDFAPDKLELVRETLVTFTNSNLKKINLSVTDLDTQFCDGVFLILLMGLLEGYFIPLYCFSPTPTTMEQRINNVQLAFGLMKEAGVPSFSTRPEDVVNGDLKSILRVLYILFSTYKET